MAKCCCAVIVEAEKGEWHGQLVPLSPQSASMSSQVSFSSVRTPPGRWAGLTVGITGPSGALGQSLIKAFLEEGARVVALSHRSRTQAWTGESQEWIRWSCGAESQLESVLESVDVLVLNHGVNPGGDQSPETLSNTLEVNAFSHWRLIQLFEAIANRDPNSQRPRELWVNTSEAEIQPALSPGYELSKRLIGELVSLRWSNRDSNQSKCLRLRKLVLGPFRSSLNPMGLMTPGFVTSQVMWQAKIGMNLIIVTPNPFTYLAMPVVELLRKGYHMALRINPHDQ